MAKRRRGTQEKSDALILLDILQKMGIAVWEASFREVFERHYLQVAEEVAKAGELVGIATNLPDPVARSVMAAGGRRAGLIDLNEQSRRAIFEALAEGRAQGEGVEQLARRIASEVGAGPWMTAQTRAMIIARTETKFAQNASTLAIGRQAGQAISSSLTAGSDPAARYRTYRARWRRRAGRGQHRWRRTSTPTGRFPSHPNLNQRKTDMKITKRG
ncbi:MAG: hypothetical protein R3D34_06790 [Nitratireductor sp.]